MSAVSGIEEIVETEETIEAEGSTKYSKVPIIILAVLAFAVAGFAIFGIIQYHVAMDSLTNLEIGVPLTKQSVWKA